MFSSITSPANSPSITAFELEKCGYEWLTEELKSGYINIFFGTEDPINVLKKFKKNSLKDFTPEEDFILGILLGYNTNQQCKRYLTRKAG